MNNAPASLVMTVVLTLLPVAVIVVLLWFMLRKAHRSTALNDRQLSRGYMITGLFWVGMGLINFFLEASRHSRHVSATFQQVYGTLAVALGSFYLGLGAQKMRGKQPPRPNVLTKKR